MEHSCATLTTDEVDNSCMLCNKKINEYDNDIECSVCHKKVHIRCNMFDKKDLRLLRDSNNHFFMCLVCLQETIPFTELDNTDFYRLIINSDNFKYSYKNTQSIPTQQLMFDGINNWVNELNLTDDDENFDNNNINCNYININEFKDLKRNSNESFSILHLNIHSLQLHIDELRTFLNMLNFKFDIIALCETKLQNEPSANVFIESYNIPIITYTETNKGRVCIYVADNLNFKLRNDLNIYGSKELVSFH